MQVTGKCRKFGSKVGQLVDYKAGGFRLFRIPSDSSSLAASAYSHRHSNGILAPSNMSSEPDVEDILMSVDLRMPYVCAPRMWVRERPTRFPGILRYPLILQDRAFVDSSRFLRFSPEYSLWASGSWNVSLGCITSNKKREPPS